MRPKRRPDGKALSSKFFNRLRMCVGPRPALALARGGGRVPGEVAAGGSAARFLAATRGLK